MNVSKLKKIITVMHFMISLLLKPNDLHNLDMQINMTLQKEMENIIPPLITTISNLTSKKTSWVKLDHPSENLEM